MTIAITLNTTDAQLHALQTVAHRAKAGTKAVRVDLTALESLICDHGQLVRACAAWVPIEKKED